MEVIYKQWQEYGLLEWEASKRIAQLLGSIYYREIIAVDGEQFCMASENRSTF